MTVDPVPGRRPRLVRLALVVVAMAAAARPLTAPGAPALGDATRAKMVCYTLGHAQDIYGQMAVHLRLNGIVPPAGRRGGV